MLKLLGGLWETPASVCAHSPGCQSPGSARKRSADISWTSDQADCGWTLPWASWDYGDNFNIFSEIRTNVGTRGQTGAWIFAIFSPVFLLVVFVFKIPVIWERTNGCGRDHRITSSLWSFNPHPCSGRGMTQRDKPLLVLSLSDGRCLSGES